MDRKSRSRACFVPDCRNSTLKNPEKLFFYVPKDLTARKRWFESVGRMDPPSEKNSYVCCQDHFNLEEDMEHYTRYSYQGGSKNLKKSAIPRVFQNHLSNCKHQQSNIKSATIHDSTTTLNQPRSQSELIVGSPSSKCHNKRAALENITNSRDIIPANVALLNEDLFRQGLSDVSRENSNFARLGKSDSVSTNPIFINPDGTCFPNTCTFNIFNDTEVAKTTEHTEPDFDNGELGSHSIEYHGREFPISGDEENAVLKDSSCIGEITLTQRSSPSMVSTPFAGFFESTKDGIIPASLNKRKIDETQLSNPKSSTVSTNNPHTSGLNTSNEGMALMDNRLDCHQRPMSIEQALVQHHQSNTSSCYVTQFGEDELVEINPSQSYTFCAMDTGEHMQSNPCNDEYINVRDIGVQTRQSLSKPHYRSKKIQWRPKVSDVSIQCPLNFPGYVDRACSPIFPARKKFKADLLSEPSEISSLSLTMSTNSTPLYEPSSSEYAFSSSGGEEERRRVIDEMKQSSLRMTLYHISRDPKAYLGIEPEWMWLINILSSETKCSTENIKLTLMKIRLNDTFSRLGHLFGLSESQASRIFKKTLKQLAHYLQTLVFIPDPDLIKKNLPIAFRARYGNVFAIVDAFEIEIEKPSNSVHQSLTWSDYKGCNTIKYNIFCTADGLIVFKSDGYGGKISDCKLFEISGILDLIPENCAIMADRGFKNLQTLLNEKKCVLLRPPSVSSSSKPTKEEVLETKTIASLRIHVERVIRRIREFEFLSPHACVDSNLIQHLDDAVTVASGLINLQKPIIKK